MIRLSPRRHYVSGPLTDIERAAGKRLNVIGEFPRHRANCVDGPRPCPWVRCKWHLAIDVTRTGGIFINQPRFLDLDYFRDSCTLDVIEANPDGVTLDVVGQMFGISRERIRQLQDRAEERAERIAKAYKASEVR